MKRQTEYEKYQVINNNLNDYCSYINNSYFLKNLKQALFITTSIGKIIQDYEDIYLSNSLNEDFLKLSINMPLEDSINIVKEYLALNTPEYMDKFEQFLNDGTINIVDDSSEEIDEEKDTYSYYDEEKNHASINLSISHDYSDPYKIIHEFMHQVDAENSNRGHSYWELTEAESIFHETNIYNYMETKGYDRSEINKCRLGRLEDLKDFIYQLPLDIILIDSFETLGPINDSTYEDRKKFNLFLNWYDKEEFEEYIDEISSIMEREDFDPMLDYSYVLGTLIAYHAVNQNNPNMAQKFVKLNEMINNNKETEDCLKVIGLDLTNEDGILKCLISFDQEVEKITSNKTNNIHIL